MNPKFKIGDRVTCDYAEMVGHLTTEICVISAMLSEKKFALRFQDGDGMWAIEESLHLAPNGLDRVLKDLPE
jgi:hypothetical protein